MRIHAHIRHIGVVMLAAGVLACNNVTRSASDAPLPSGLMVFPGATNVVRTQDFAGVVRFELDDPYPAQKSIGVLESQLRKDGWTPQADDFMSAGSPPRRLREWLEVDAPGEHVFMWVGQWVDARGNIAHYLMTYRVPFWKNQRKPTGPLRVQGIIYSPSAAHALTNSARVN